MACRRMFCSFPSELVSYSRHPGPGAFFLAACLSVCISLPDLAVRLGHHCSCVFPIRPLHEARQGKTCGWDSQPQFPKPFERVAARPDSAPPSLSFLCTIQSHRIAHLPTPRHSMSSISPPPDWAIGTEKVLAACSRNEPRHPFSVNQWLGRIPTPVEPRQRCPLTVLSGVAAAVETPDSCLALRSFFDGLPADRSVLISTFNP